MRVLVLALGVGVVMLSAGRGNAAPPAVAATTACSGTAIVFVVDRSGSMTGAPLEAAKDATLAAAKLLGPNDCAEVIAFDSAATVFHAFGAADLERHVRAITSGGGTSFQPPLSQARLDLGASAAKKKHILLVSDGQSPKDGLAALADQIVAKEATLSTIALGADADETLLNDLATRGHGTFAKSKAPAGLSPLFEADVRTALK